jgi:hypothetical protein
MDLIGEDSCGASVMVKHISESKPVVEFVIN